ncbi:MAG: lipocalin family protein [Acidobacteriota bacterium]
MKSVVAVLIIAAVLVSAGCKSSAGPEDTESFLGTWNATKAEYTSAANSSTKVDIVAGGSTAVLVLNATTFTLTITDPGESAVVAGGTWSASTDVLTLTWTSGNSGTTQFDYTLSGDNLTLNDGHVLYDFTPGSPEEALLDLVLHRQ